MFKSTKKGQQNGNSVDLGTNKMFLLYMFNLNYTSKVGGRQS